MHKVDDSSRERARHIGAVLGPDTRRLVATMTLPSEAVVDRVSGWGHQAAGKTEDRKNILLLHSSEHHFFTVGLSPGDARACTAEGAGLHNDVTHVSTPTSTQCTAIVGNVAIEKIEVGKWHIRGRECDSKGVKAGKCHVRGRVWYQKVFPRTKTSTCRAVVLSMVPLLLFFFPASLQSPSPPHPHTPFI